MSAPRDGFLGSSLPALSLIVRLRLASGRSPLAETPACWICWLGGTEGWLERSGRLDSRSAGAFSIPCPFRSSEPAKSSWFLFAVLQRSLRRGCCSPLERSRSAALPAQSWLLSGSLNPNQAGELWRALEEEGKRAGEGSRPTASLSERRRNQARRACQFLHSISSSRKPRAES